MRTVEDDEVGVQLRLGSDSLRYRDAIARIKCDRLASCLRQLANLTCSSLSSWSVNDKACEITSHAKERRNVASQLN